MLSVFPIQLSPGSRRSDASTNDLLRWILCGLIICLTACDTRGPTIETLRAGGELRVALVSVPHTYYLEPDGILGFDYELLRAFCDELDIRLKVTLVPSRALAANLVAKKKVHLAAGLLPVSDALDTRVRFGPSYAMLQSRVIYRAGEPRPRGVSDLNGAVVETIAGGSGRIELDRLAASNPALNYATSPDMSSEKLLVRLNAGAIDYAVIPSLDFEVLRLKYPQLEAGFDLGPPRAAAWALSEQFEPSIDHAIVDFFVASQQNRLRQALWHRYYGHYGEFDFVDARAFLRAYDERLPAYRALFEAAAAEVGIDWRLLAALSYQESHWDRDARSPTGVRGLMMLTRRTAAEMNVSRDVPAEAISGGARYLADLIARLPASIEGEQRLWFGLAAYNIGLGHVEDARVLTQQAGRDPDAWHEVSKYLALLSKRNVASKTRYGRARGEQTLHFVTNIRRYFDTVRQLERREVVSADAHGEGGIFILQAL